jgi:hypothetical protein
MTMAPVEYLLVGFPDNEFNGRLAPALADLVERNTVRVLDLVFVSKDDNGDIATFEFDQLDELRAFAGVGGDSRGMINEEDLEHAAEALEPGSSAALLIWEDLWAAGFAEALHDCNAVLLEGGRIPHDLVEAALDELAESG